MKIGIFDPYLDTLGGGEKYMLTIAECLSASHDVSLFWDDEEIRRKAEGRFLLNLSNIHFVPDIFSDKAGIVRRFSATRKYDLIIFLSNGTIPTVFSKQLFLHFQFPTEWIHELSPQTKVKLLRVNKIICNSSYTKEYIEQLFGRECIVVYPPVDIDHAFSKVEKENIVLTVGRYTRPHGMEFKKHSFLIERFKQISKVHKNWKFIIITSSLPEDGKYIEELREKAKNFPIEVFENVPREKILLFYKKAKIYWHAAGFGEDLEKYPDMAEHFGIVTVEAMNRGAVPIVFAAGGQKEIVKNGRSGYLWNNENDLIEKTEFLMTHEKDRVKLAKQAFDDSLKFSKKRFCKEITSLVS